MTLAITYKGKTIELMDSADTPNFATGVADAAAYYGSVIVIDGDTTHAFTRGVNGANVKAAIA